MSSIRALVVLGVMALILPGSSAAQDRLLPAVRSFELPEASPRVYGVVGRLLSTRRGESRFGDEREAEVVLGENLPLVSIKGGSHSIVLGVGSQVYGRFSLDDSKTALISVDWVAALNTTALLVRLPSRCSSTTRVAIWATSTGIASRLSEWIGVGKWSPVG